MLTWRPELAVGHPDIDADHKRLIAIINDFERMVENSPKERALHEVLVSLHDYARVHFAREEELQAAAGYSGLERHRREHQALLHSVKEMASRHFVVRTQPITAESLDTLGHFLRRWLVDHIIKSDLKLRDYVRAMPGAAAR
jgi:hemerythrin